MTTTTPADAADRMTPLQQELIMSAIQLAKNQQVQKVAVLKTRLLSMYSEAQESDVEAALRFIANRLQSHAI